MTGQMSESQALKFELECNTASARLLRSECDHVKEELGGYGVPSLLVAAPVHTLSVVVMVCHPF